MTDLRLSAASSAPQVEAAEAMCDWRFRPNAPKLTGNSTLSWLSRMGDDNKTGHPSAVAAPRRIKAVRGPGGRPPAPPGTHALSKLRWPSTA
ncbi:hypothetical protein EVAR_3867_1 [Eumeta japonica]|uniref:Uncharacterized protein n=1 Tax=Eumeta variegata TaxID=151549 RepID=A0A4C1ST31_EUMVA|nr:hypothetical protein EVAR_3867_1 [Eumeta japonica]